MNKYLYLLLLPIIALVAVSCNDEEEDTKPTILMRYLVGNWEVVKSDHPEYATIYEITEDIMPSTGTVGYRGSLTTYYLTEDNPPMHDKAYSWEIVAIEDTYYPLIELVWQADIDGKAGDEPADRFYYRIEELTPTSMRWHINSVTGEETINFIRRTDLDDK